MGVNVYPTQWAVILAKSCLQGDLNPAFRRDEITRSEQFDENAQSTCCGMDVFVTVNYAVSIGIAFSFSQIALVSRIHSDEWFSNYEKKICTFEFSFVVGHGPIRVGRR
jgi:hypothetical protein